MSEVDEVAEIRQVIDTYLQGCRTGRGELLESIFHRDAWMYGSSEGKRSDWPLTRIMELVGERPTGTGHRAEVISILRHGDAATVVIAEDGYYGKAYIDHFSLSRHDGRWLVVNKTYQRLS